MFFTTNNKLHNLQSLQNSPSKTKSIVKDNKSGKPHCVVKLHFNKVDIFVPNVN